MQALLNFVLCACITGLSHDDLFLLILGKGRHTLIVAHQLEMLHAPIS